MPAKRLQVVAHVCIQKIKAVRSSEKLVSFHQTKGFNMPEHDDVRCIKTNDKVIRFVI